MSLDDIQSLEEAASSFPLYKGLAESWKIRKLRQLVNEKGTPCIREGKKIFFKPEHIEELIDSLETECRSKSKKSKTRKTGTSVEPSGELRSISLRGLRTEMLQIGKEGK